MKTKMSEKEYKIKLDDFIKNLIFNYKEIKASQYNKSLPMFRDITYFESFTRSNSTEYNKKRELIISSIINGKIPELFYRFSIKWYNLKKELDCFIDKLCFLFNIKKIYSIECKNTGSTRSNYFDFLLDINKFNFKIEFKFNADKINKTPQFVSPGKPSIFLSSSYEEFYYDNYFNSICEKYNFKIPDKSLYLKQINNNKPKCVEKIQEKYYKGCKNSSKFTNIQEDINFYNDCKVLSKKSISSFIDNNSLNIEKLSKYLIDTKKDKIYMLYKNGHIFLEIVDKNEYKIKSYIKSPNTNTFILTTENNKKIKILLRWKNGNGIAFPAFQIS